MNSFDNIELVIMILSIFISCVSLYITFKTKRRYERLAIKLGNGEDISHILKDYIEKVDKLDIKENAILNYCKDIDDESQKNLKKVGLVKYNAFDDTKNNLSFALALLNESNSGVLFSYIYNRYNNSTIFVKEIKNGESKSELAREEIESIEIAKRNKQLN